MAGRYPSNSEHGATNLVALVLRYRARHAAQDAALLSLAEAVDEKLARLRADILGGAGEAFDTLLELQQLLEADREGIAALKALAAGHVKFDAAQGLTASQQAQARANIGAVSGPEMDAAINAAIPLAPTARVEQTASGATISITDSHGSSTASVSHGKDGAAGPYYQPILAENGDLSWINNGGLPNPATRNIMGAPGLPGEQGPQGEPGSPGAKGDPGPQGEKGDKGDAGAPGETGPRGVTFTPSVSASGVLSWTNDGQLANPAAVDLMGAQGPQGEPGPKGDKGEQGKPGTPGETPDMTAYLTRADYALGFDGGDL